MTEDSPSNPAGARPRLIVVSAPSGAGKSTLCNRLRAAHPEIVYSVSCTTRPPRGSEADGQAYHFLSAAEFQRRVDAGEFLEHATVHGHRYGTLVRTVREALAAGRSVLMDIDVQGAAQIRRYVLGAPEGDPLRSAFVDIFIEPPSLDALRQRLAGRNEDRPEEIERRLRNAAAEMDQRHLYRHRVVNDELDAACRAFDAIVQRERAARGLQQEGGRGT